MEEYEVSIAKIYILRYQLILGKACYIFSPDETDGLAQRPSKRRKTEPVQASKPHTDLPFVPLLRGREVPKNVKSRFEALKALWTPREAIVDVDEKICTVLLVARPDNGISASLLEAIVRGANKEGRTISANLSSSSSTNLKSVLKSINQLATTQGNEEPVGSPQVGIQYSVFGKPTDVARLQESRRMNYDLEILYTHAKLSKNAIQCLRGKEFGLEDVYIEALLAALLTPSPVRGIIQGCQSTDAKTVWLGPVFSRMIVDRQKEYIQSSFSFTQALKLAYMSHFFSNPLSSALASRDSVESWQEDHMEAVRNLPSFRRYCETLLVEKDHCLVRTLLDNDSILKQTVKSGLRKCGEALRNITSAVNTLYNIHSRLTRDSSIWFDAYILAMSNRLADSDLLNSSLSSLKKVQSYKMLEILDVLVEDRTLPPEIKSCHESLSQLTEETAPARPSGLRSGYDIQHANLRTTVVAQRVELSKHATTVTLQEVMYTKIVDRLDQALQSYFQGSLINPKDLFLHEIFVYDLPSPHRDVFNPRTRFAIERALSSPHDYLGNECCDDTSEGLSASQPATAILYQLYLESGSLINTADLWSAFWIIVGNEDAEDEEQEHQRALALFSRALAELKYLGMVKHSRKKADHLTKLSWKGL
ncbi:MAG: hypothetical protein Q9217_003041 [Psora testacea]